MVIYEGCYRHSSCLRFEKLFKSLLIFFLFFVYYLLFLCRFTELQTSISVFALCSALMCDVGVCWYEIECVKCGKDESDKTVYLKQFCNLFHGCLSSEEVLQDKHDDTQREMRENHYLCFNF